MQTGLIYIPKYVRQESDLEYGEKVTHENYNEKLNLNTTQGDYNTEVLFKLLTSRDVDDVYHIPYLDKAISDVANTIGTIYDDVGILIQDNLNIHEDLNNIGSDVTKIQDGTTTVGKASVATSIESGLTAGPSKYYGTDANSNLGFIDLPEFIYAIDMETSTGVDGIYYVPALNSVTEPMLSAAVREKLNREAVVDYDYLDNRPQINSVLLTGNKSLNDLGIQPVGNYVTDSALNSTLSNYYTITAAQSWVNTQLNSYATTAWVNTQLSSYATSSALTTVSNKANAAAVIQVGSTFSGTPKNGDLLITV